MAAGCVVYEITVLSVLLVGVCSALPHSIQKRQTEEICKGKADVIFALDSSGSVGITNYESSKTYLQEVVEKMDVSATDIRIGGLHYSSSPYKDFDIGVYLTRTDVIAAIGLMPYPSGNTHTHLAIDLVQSMIAQQARTATDIARIGVVLTDGQSVAALTAQAADAAKNAGISMISVGIGQSVSVSELEAIASPPISRNVILIEDFTKLNEAINKLANVICDSANGTSTIPINETGASETTTIPIDETAITCVSDCTGIPNGYYQSCQGCDVYLTCSNEITYDGRPCGAAGLVWDDGVKRCEWTSNTCP